MSGFIPFPKLPTGDSASLPTTRYSFLAPPDLWILRALSGLISDYSNPGSWYQEGLLTPEDAANIFSQIYSTFGVDMATTGVIVPFAGGILPTDWLPCDGRSLLRADFANLFAAIGTTWGSVDSSHFNIPDLRGKTIVGQGTNPSTGTSFNLGSYGGEEKHTQTTSEMPSHAHTDAGHVHTESGAVPTVINGGLEAPAPSATPTASVTGSGNANIQPAGGGQAFNVMQPYGVVNYAIIT